MHNVEPRGDFSSKVQTNVIFLLLNSNCNTGGKQSMLNNLLHRCIGVYFPRKMREEGFRTRCKLLIPLAWFLAYCPTFIPLSGAYNIIGLTCKTFGCTFLNINSQGQPQKDIRQFIGPPSIVLTLILLITLNLATYRRLWVRRNRLYIFYNVPL